MSKDFLQADGLKGSFGRVPQMYTHVWDLQTNNSKALLSLTRFTVWESSCPLFFAMG